jgi:hypothetical protein
LKFNYKIEPHSKHKITLKLIAECNIYLQSIVEILKYSDWGCQTPPPFFVQKNNLFRQDLWNMSHRCGMKVHNRPALYRHRTSLGFKIQGLLSASSDQLGNLKDPTMGEIETTTQETIRWETKVCV